MAAHTTDSSDDMISGINVTPLVDVVLVLLVVLMVTSSYLASHSIPVDLPKGATGETVDRVLAVSVTREGLLFLDGKPLGDQAFRDRVRDAHERDPELRAVIAADGSASHRNVVHVIDLLRQEHVSRFALDVDPEVITPKP